MHGDRYGLHRVIEPRGVLPQAAQRIDNDMKKRFDDEIVIDVECLNVDSASFVQMEQGAATDEQRRAQVRAAITETVRTRGKQHNPVTGSGGMLLGRVAHVGEALKDGPHGSLQVGERIATLVSLSLTPLHLDGIDDIDLHRHQVRVRGRAILFETGAWSRLPASLPESVSLSALDVAGAAPQVTRLVERMVAQGVASPVVAILGCGGKSGLLCTAAAKRAGARVVGIERSEAAAAGARRLGMADIGIANAADALAVSSAVTKLAGGLVDLTVSCVNVPDAEMGAILSTRDGGVIYFFSMATSFTKAALGAEGVSRDIDMLVGNGYAPGHAQATLDLLEAEPTLRAIFIERFGD
ncbi:MAG: zinc-binding dehydrogenase [Polyangia bacterium]